MTGRAIRVAWVVAQLCYLPVAPARYLHDFLGYLVARYFMPEHVESVSVNFRGYRLDWEVEWTPDASNGAKRATLLLPVLIGLGAFGYLSPFWKTLWFVPPGELAQLGWSGRAALEFLVLQLLALPWPRARDLPRWRAWWPADDADVAMEVVD